MTRPPQLGTAEPLNTARIVVPFIPCSSKNRTQIRKHGRGPNARRSIAKSDLAASHQAAIRVIASRVLRNLPAEQRTLFGSHYVRVEVRIDEQAERTEILVHDHGPQPKRGRRGTKRDVHGTLETVMDAMQGVVFDDDRQCRGAIVEWSVVECRETSRSSIGDIAKSAGGSR